MWLSIVMAIISYFTTRASGSDKKTAALAAIAGGVGTAYAVSSTEWGKNAASSFDSTLGLSNDPLVTSAAEKQAADALVPGAPKVDTTNPVVGATAWDSIKAFAASGSGLLLAGAAGAAAGSSGLLEKAIPWVAGGLLVYFVLK